MSDLTPDRGASGDDRRPTDDRVKAARPGRAVLPGEGVLPIDKDRSSTDHRGDGTADDPGAATRRDTTAGTAGTAGSAGAVGAAGTAGAAGPTGAKPRPLTPETVTDAGASTGTSTGTNTGTVGAKGREPGSASTSGAPVPPITAPTAGPSSSTASAPSGTPVEREAHAARTASSSTSGEHGGASLFPEDESDRISARMRHAVVGFVDGPRDAVAEADEVLEELAARLTDAVDRRRRTLRGSWHQPEGGKDRAASAATAVDTEQLRLALRDYRELTERLLHL
ncbi:hypothetical protein [Streptomyces sp. LUP30]|uniref:hypothetical protein n=1 Tax=Streptomyces sp. LUP30 TaxID=1890285 RepID=UPI0009A05ACC|nr:hypothetical protein [Streptomyces sp. LUP30]